MSHGLRIIPRRVPRYSLWIKGTPLSSSSRHQKGYQDRIREVASAVVNGALLTGTRLEVEIIFAARGGRLDVDNAAKRILDALEGAVYAQDTQVRAVKILGVRLDEGFRIRGSQAVFDRLLAGKEFLINIYDEVELDIVLVDSAGMPHDEEVLGLIVARAVPPC